VKVINVFSPPKAVAGAVTTGARSPIVMFVVAEPESAFTAVNVTAKTPVWVVDGVQLNVPDVFVAFDVNVAPEGKGAAVSEVIRSPSGSTALTVKLMGVPEIPATDDGAVTIGGRKQLGLMEMLVTAEPESKFEPVNVTLYAPD
jgi:hypothetical protein